DRHEKATERALKTVVADSKYGTVENFLACHDRGLQAHMPDLYLTRSNKKKWAIFSEDQFRYDPLKDVYICPTGTVMPCRAKHTKRRSMEYRAPRKACVSCELREQCTRNKSGRSITRHMRQEELESMRQASQSPKAKRDIKTRQHLMERSFARGERLGFDRARWRGLWRMEIQECLTCVVQNIQVLLSRIRPSIQAAAKAMTVPTKRRKCRDNYLPWAYLGLDVMQIGHFFETGVIDSICIIVGCNQSPQMAGC
ncbi:MAG: transposase, partial [Desulfobulbaceae bacterium]|nr:transposase [Desulfobulbaceae bacterium]